MGKMKGVCDFCQCWGEWDGRIYKSRESAARRPVGLAAKIFWIYRPTTGDVDSTQANTKFACPRCFRQKEEYV